MEIAKYVNSVDPYTLPCQRTCVDIRQSLAFWIGTKHIESICACIASKILRYTLRDTEGKQNTCQCLLSLFVMSSIYLVLFKGIHEEGKVQALLLRRHTALNSFPPLHPL